jgi:hypothetical protein
MDVNIEEGYIKTVNIALTEKEAQHLKAVLGNLIGGGEVRGTTSRLWGYYIQMA